MSEPIENLIEPRFIELETKIAFLENLLETLNEVVTGQQTSIDALMADMKVLTEQIASAEDESE